MIIRAENLRKLIKQIFMKYGLSEEDSIIASNCLVLAEMVGISTHGVEMVPAHINKCLNGYNIHARLKVLKESDSFSLCDADNAIGMVSAWKCTDLAISKANESGVHIVFCNNANTFSAAYSYVFHAVNNKKIAIVISNSPAQMAPLGGKEKLFGTNPLAIGVPAHFEAPFILDMATSAVAKSKINQAVKDGKTSIPFGWATDQNGNPTDNPKEALKGLMLPMAGAKGYGLAMAIDIIAGLLSKANYLDNVGRFYSQDNKCMNVGHTIIAIDPVKIYGADFYDEMDLYLKKVKQSQKADNQEVFIPGELNKIRYERALREGVYISDLLLDQLRKL